MRADECPQATMSTSRPLPRSRTWLGATRSAEIQRMCESDTPSLIGPFTRPQARAVGITDRMLDGKAHVRLFPRVWCRRDHEMTAGDWVRAASLALPEGAHATGITRLQQLGLDYGPRRPLRFVIEGDHHVAPDGIFLHRTKQLPPLDDDGVSAAAAYISYVSRARVIDAIKVGDWVLKNTGTTLADIRDLALAHLWRDGAEEAIWVLDDLDERARSIKESETRAVLVFAGLPRPESNSPVPLGDDAVAIGDLVYRRWRLVIEYEGRQHQTDRERYHSDLDRYALFRAHDVHYVQVTYEKLTHPRTLVGEVFRELLVCGYDGPPPTFGAQWALLFAPVRVAVGPRRQRISRAS